MTTPDHPDAPADPQPEPSRSTPRSARGKARRQSSGSPRSGLFAPRPRWEKSPAAVAGFVGFLWGMSLLVQEWLRTTWFEPRGLSATLLAAPFFAAAVACALLAMRARAAGRPALGGPGVHRFGIASGLVGATALALALYMAPRLLELQESARLARSRARLQELVIALEGHARKHGAYPSGSGGRVLRALDDAFGGHAPTRDPWGHDLEYRSLAGGRGYLLLSLGRDGVADVPLTDYLDERRRKSSGDDIVVINGRFLDAQGLGDPILPELDPELEPAPELEPGPGPVGEPSGSEPGGEPSGSEPGGEASGPELEAGEPAALPLAEPPAPGAADAAGSPGPAAAGAPARPPAGAANGGAAAATAPSPRRPARASGELPAGVTLAPPPPPLPAAPLPGPAAASAPRGRGPTDAP